MLKKLLSISIVGSLSFGIIACNKTENSKNEANKNSKPNIIETSERKNVSNDDYENLKTVINIDMTNVLQDNFKSNLNIKRVIATQKRKSEDETQKDKYIFFDIDKDKINNVNCEDVANKAIEILSKNEVNNFWKRHEATIFFKTPEEKLNLYSVYVKKQDSGKLIKIEK